MTTIDSQDFIPGLEPHPTRPWKETATLAQARRANSLAAVDPPHVSESLPLNVTSISAELLTARENEITSKSPEHSLQDLKCGRCTCVEVTKAFLRRAALAQALSNCVTDLLPERALARAEQLDAHMAQNGSPVGPLHGLPISVKEHVGMKGLDLNSGYCTFYGLVVDEDALILQILAKAGAVFHARTMEPQTLMHLETDNNLYGRTLNPHNTSLTSGGSSGGESALIALGGSIIGIGTDIGGSIRNPAANCGLYGFKPTSGRLPMFGVADGSEGFEQIKTAIGPLSTTLEGIKIFMKTVLDAKPWLKEPSCVPLPWDAAEHLLPKKLRVGFFQDDEVVLPHPPVLRAMKETLEKLSDAADVELVEWAPYKHDEAWKTIASLYFPDGGAEEAEAMAATGEPWQPLTEFIIRDNPFVKSAGLTIKELWTVTAHREQYRTEYNDQWNRTATQWDEQGVPLDAVDVLLCPAGPGAAPPHDCSRYWGYTSQWNLLDYPALVFPITKVDPNLDRKDQTYQPRNADDKYNYELYGPDKYTDAPVCLQLVGRRYEDGKVIQAMEKIRTYL